MALISGRRNISVFAVQSKITLSFLSLQALMSALTASMSSSLVPVRTLSQRSAWLEAMKSGLRTAFMGTIFFEVLLELLNEGGLEHVGPLG